MSILGLFGSHTAAQDGPVPVAKGTWELIKWWSRSYTGVWTTTKWAVTITAALFVIVVPVWCVCLHYGLHLGICKGPCCEPDIPSQAFTLSLAGDRKPKLGEYWMFQCDWDVDENDNRITGNFNLTKQVVGLPGDTISFRDIKDPNLPEQEAYHTIMTRNGQDVVEGRWQWPLTHPDRPKKPVTARPDEYLLLASNRLDLASLYLYSVQRDKLVGHVIARTPW